MRDIKEEERRILIKNSKDCYDTTFRAREKANGAQMTLAIFLVIFITVAGVVGFMFLTDMEFSRPSQRSMSSMAAIVGVSLFGSFSVIFGKMNDKKGIKYFLRSGKLQVNGAEVKKIGKDFVLLLEDGETDAAGNPYLLEYHTQNTDKLSALAPYERILVLHGENKKHAPVTRIMKMSPEVSTAFADVKAAGNPVDNWEQLNYYPHKSVAALKRGRYIPTPQEKEEMFQKEYQAKKKEQGKGVGLCVIIFSVIVILFGALIMFIPDDNMEVSSRLSIILVIAAVLFGLLFLISLLGRRNVKKSIPEMTQIREVMFLGMNPGVDAANMGKADLCYWDETIGNYVQKELRMKNLYAQKLTPGTIYYMILGEKEDCYLMNKEREL